MTVKRIYDIDKIIVYEAKEKQIVDLAIKPSLTNQSVFSSKSIAHAVGWSITVEMISMIIWMERQLKEVGAFFI